MNIQGLWKATPCQLVKSYWWFRTALCLCLHDMQTKKGANQKTLMFF